MRHEIIRMEHVNISRPGRHEIEDLNLIICRRGTAKVHSRKRTGFKRLLREPPLVDLFRIVGKVEVMKLNRL